MSDNVTELDLEPMPDRRGLFKKIVVFLVILAAVLSFVALVLFSDGLNLDSLRRMVKYLNVDSSGFGSFVFDSHSSNQYAAFGDGLAVASVGGLEIYDQSGEEIFVLQKQLDLPQLQVEDDLAMAYDVSGKSLLMLHAREGEVLRLDEKRPILDVDLSEGGYLCLSTSASGYKSVLSVYSNEQDLIYRWLSSTTYIPLCSISPNGRDLAAVALGQSEGVYESSLYLFKTDSEEIQHAVSLGSELIYDVSFVRDDVICAIGESAAFFVNLKGELLNSYSYAEQNLKDFDDGGDGFLSLTLNMYRAGNRYSIVNVDDKGNELASLYIGKEILDISACGRYVAVLTPDDLTIYTQSLHVYHQTVETGNATAVVMREDGSVLLMGNGEGHLYVP